MAMMVKLSERQRDIYRWPYPIPRKAIVLRFVVEGNPMPKERPRVGAMGTFTPPKTRAYEAEVAWKLREILRDTQPDKDTFFGIRCIFYRENFIRTDIDNLCKSVADAANGQIWQDDSQIVEMYGKLFRGDARPRADVLVYRVVDED